jgi:hypothetical protein
MGTFILPDWELPSCLTAPRALRDIEVEVSPTSRRHDAEVDYRSGARGTRRMRWR